MSTRERDYFPTPPDAGLALRLWWDDARPMFGREVHGWLDPMAGPGLLLEYMTEHPTQRAGIEIDTRWVPHLRETARVAVQADAFEVDWLDVPNPTGSGNIGLLANPAFSLMRPFLARMMTHLRARKTVAIVLVRLPWLREYLPDGVPWPTHLVDMGWRLSFSGDGRCDRAAEHVWAVWDGRALDGPNDCAMAWRVTRPAVPAELAARHKALSLGLSPKLQPRLDLGEGTLA